MSRLSIITNWCPAELCINIIPVEMKAELESIGLELIKLIENEFPETEDIDIILKDIWYNLESYSQWFWQVGIDTDNWRGRGICLVDYSGPSFSDIDEIHETISNKHNSKRIDFLIDGMETSCSVSKENCIFQEMVKPQPSKNELAVYHGGTSWTEMTFELDIDDPLEESKLVFKFTDCGKHGYILNSITYAGEEMEKDYDPHKESFLDLEIYNGKLLKEVEISDFSAGDMIADRYRVERELGRGGMGVVYLVSDTRLRERKVALKMIHSELGADPKAMQRFVDEVRTCLDLAHSNIVRVYNLEDRGELPFFTMEYVPGRSLREWINQRKNKQPAFSLPEVIAIVNPLLEALSYAHQFTIHRDIKPDNIMVRGEFPEVEIKVLDFGIAKTMSLSRLTQTAHVMGTVYYMAPEQMKASSEVDHRADLYSVGMVLYEMLAGNKAVGFFQLPSTLIPALPTELDVTIKKALAPMPEERFQDAPEMKKALLTAFKRYKEARRQKEKKIEKREDS